MNNSTEWSKPSCTHGANSFRIFVFEGLRKRYFLATPSTAVRERSSGRIGLLSNSTVRDIGEEPYAGSVALMEFQQELLATHVLKIAFDELVHDTQIFHPETPFAQLPSHAHSNLAKITLRSFSR